MDVFLHSSVRFYERRSSVYVISLFVGSLQR